MPTGEAPKSIKASLYIDGKPAENSIKDVSQVARVLKRDLDQLTYGTEAFNKKAAELQNVTRYLQEMKEQASGMGDQFMKVKATLTDLVESVAIGTLISQAIRGALAEIKDFISGVEKAYEDMTAVQVAITNKLRQTGMVAGETGEALKKYAETLSDQTGIEDVVIQKAEDMLLTYTNIRGYIYKEALPAALNLTAAENNGRVTMENVSASAEKLAKALERPTEAKKELKQMGIDLTNQQQEEIKMLNNSNQLQKAQQIIIDEVNKRFGNLNKTMADSELGPAQRYEKRLNSLSENLGRLWKEGKNVSSEVFAPFVEWMEKITRVDVVGKLRDEQEGLNSLVGAIVSTNDNQAIRNHLIDALQQKYPDFIGNIKKEAATNDLLLQKLEQINQQYRDKIFIASNEAKIKDIQEERNKAIQREADARERVAKATGKSAVELAKLTDEQIKQLAVDQAKAERAKLHKGLNQYDGGSVEQQLKAQFADQDAETILNGRKAIEQSFKDESELMQANEVYEKKVTDARIAGIDAQIKAIQKKISTEKEEAKVTDQAELKRLETERNTILGIVEKPTSGPTQQEIDEAKRKYDELMKQRQAYVERSKDLSNQVAAFNAAELADTLAKNDKEVKALQNKYDSEIVKLQEFISKSFDSKGKLNKDANQGEIEKHQAQIAQLGADKQKATADLIAKQQKDLNDRLEAFNNQLAAKLQADRDKEIEAINRFYDQQKKDAGTNADQLKAIEIKRAAALNQAKLNEEKQFQEEKARIEEGGDGVNDNKDKLAILKINKKYDAEVEALKQKYTKELQATKEFQDALALIERQRQGELLASGKTDEEVKKKMALDFAQQTTNAIFTISSRSRQADTGAKLQKLESEKNAELSNKNLTESQRAAINKKYADEEAQLKLKQWKADQAAAAEQALINAALAYMKLFVTYPGGFADPLFDAAAIELAAATAAQEAIILTQPAPAFATGGSTNPAGFVNRATLFRSPASGRQFVAGEAGSEWIAPNWMVQSPRYSNIIGMLEGARQQKNGYAAGGYNGLSSSAADGGSGRLDRIEAALELHSALFAQQAEINETPVVLNYRTLDIFGQKVVAVKNAANGG